MQVYLDVVGLFELPLALEPFCELVLEELLLTSLPPLPL